MSAATTEWILVDDRLPASDSRVLVAFLQRFSNADWSFDFAFASYSGKFYVDGHAVTTPYAWAAISTPPMPSDAQSVEARALAIKMRDLQIYREKQHEAIDEEYSRKLAALARRNGL